MASLELDNLVQEWLRMDKVAAVCTAYCLSLSALQNEVTRAEIQELLASGNTTELDRRMRHVEYCYSYISHLYQYRTRIEFGTAGALHR